MSKVKSLLKWYKDQGGSIAEAEGIKFSILPFGEDYLLTVDGKEVKRASKSICKAEAEAYIMNLLPQKEVEEKNAEEAKVPRKRKKSSPVEKPKVSPDDLVWQVDPTPEQGQSARASYLHWTTKDSCYRVTRAEWETEIRFYAMWRDGESPDSGGNNPFLHFESEEGLGSGHPKCYKNIQACFDACLSHRRELSGNPDVQAVNVEEAVNRAGDLGTPRPTEIPKKTRSKKAASAPTQEVEEAPETEDNPQNHSEESEDMTKTAIKPMKVTEKEARKLFLEMGFKKAGDWGIPKLTKSLNNIIALIDEAQDVSGDSLTLLKRVAEANAQETPIKVSATPGRKPKEATEDDEPVAKTKEKKPKAEKPAAKDKPEKNNGSTKPKKVKAEEPTKKKEKPEKNGAVRHTILGSIYNLLSKATRKKPLPLSVLTEEVIKQHSDRNAKSVSDSVKWYLYHKKVEARYGVEIQSSEDGYWIAS